MMVSLFGLMKMMLMLMLMLMVHSRARPCRPPWS